MDNQINIKYLYPCIKWIGSKLQQTKMIIPKIIERSKCKPLFIEPFVGGGSIIIELLKYCYGNEIKDYQFICADINPIIIKMYNEIKNNPLELIERLEQYVDKISKDDF